MILSLIFTIILLFSFFKLIFLSNIRLKHKIKIQLIEHKNGQGFLAFFKVFIENLISFFSLNHLEKKLKPNEFSKYQFTIKVIFIFTVITSIFLFKNNF